MGWRCSPAPTSLKEMKMTRKVIEVNDEMNQVLSCVCDAALKMNGLSMHASVAKLINAIREEPSEKESIE